MNLKEFLERAPMSSTDALVAIRDILLGMDGLHSTGLVHCDLHAENVFVGPGGFFLGDIGGHVATDDGNGGTVYTAMDMEAVRNAVHTVLQAVDGANISPSEYSVCDTPGRVASIISNDLAVPRPLHARAVQVLSKFDRRLSQPARSYNQATLLSLAAMADELIAALQGAPARLR
jgi:serine/threonine protein kinase